VQLPELRQNEYFALKRFALSLKNYAHKVAYSPIELEKGLQQ
jgi:hypothetical protein